VVNLIITDRAVFEVSRETGLTLIDLAVGETVESVAAVTEAPFSVREPLGQFG
jgi:acyl CoA:acetate/3-ketoacid CoA transferase beta subunit